MTRQRRLHTWALSLSLAAAVAGLVGCGGGEEEWPEPQPTGGGETPPPPPPPPPPGPGDSDRDGVADGSDQCANTPAGSAVDSRGCPPLQQTTVLEGLEFETDSAVINPETYTILDRAVLLIRDYPSVRMEIQGHTDTEGSDQHNQVLSQQRAESVMQYMIEHGIPADRLVARGYGETSPRASNQTPEGRAQNRRIELHVIP